MEKRRVTQLLILLVLCHALVLALGYGNGGPQGGGQGGGGQQGGGQGGGGQQGGGQGGGGPQGGGQGGGGPQGGGQGGGGPQGGGQGGGGQQGGGQGGGGPEGGGQGGGGPQGGGQGGGGPQGGGQGGQEGKKREFLLEKWEKVVESEGGELRVVKSVVGKIVQNPLHIGFLQMEPSTLFVPQYLDSDLILFIHRGQARLGTIYGTKFVQRSLKIGDIYRIPAGMVFYLVNPDDGQRLHAVLGIDPSQSLGLDVFQSFYIGGGTDPKSILAGFDPEIIASGFNVSVSEAYDILRRKKGGPFVRFSQGQKSPKLWTEFGSLAEHGNDIDTKTVEEEQEGTWWRKMLGSFFQEKENKSDDDDKKGDGAPDSYNIYRRNPDFRNAYGWSTQIDQSEYPPLMESDIGVYLVNLSAGSMLVPHVNPTATEYGIVLNGVGKIQIVYPNGTTAMNANVKAGDVFYIPRYFAFCQIASRTGPFEFFGFTTSARRNQPQFLAGSGSLLEQLFGPELAASFGVSVKRLGQFVGKQNMSLIIPSAPASPPGEGGGRGGGGGAGEVSDGVVPEVIKAFGDVIMDFN